MLAEIMLAGMASSQNSMVGQNGFAVMVITNKVDRNLPNEIGQVRLRMDLERLSGIDGAKYIIGNDPMVANTRRACEHW